MSRNRGLLQLQDAGKLRGLDGDLEKGFGLDLQPYITAGWDKESEDLEFDTGLDLFYQITPNMTTTPTFKTDFAETEVDQRVVNLTRFPLFFPEKRDFFLEGAEFFKFGTSKGSIFRPFHSRTIGLSNSGQKIDIVGGGKLTGRAGNLGIGLLGASLDDYENLEREEVYVGRFTYQILEESQIGLIGTHGDPRTNGDNSLLGIDLNLKNSHVAGDNVVTGSFWGVQTEDQGETGTAFGTQIRGINDPFAFLVEAEEVEDTFRPAMGFLRRTGQWGRIFCGIDFGLRINGCSGTSLQSMKTSGQLTMGTWKRRSLSLFRPQYILIEVMTFILLQLLRGKSSLRILRFGQVLLSRRGTIVFNLPDFI